MPAIYKAVILANAGIHFDFFLRFKVSIHFVFRSGLNITNPSHRLSTRLGSIAFIRVSAAHRRFAASWRIARFFSDFKSGQNGFMFRLKLQDGLKNVLQLIPSLSFI